MIGRLFLAFAFVLSTQTALALNTAKAVQMFGVYLDGEISAEVMAQSLIQNPSKAEENLTALNQIVISQGLLQSNNLAVKAKLLDLQNEINKVVNAHNAEVLSQRKKIKVGGTAVGVVIGGIIAAKYSSSLMKGGGDFNMGLAFVPFVWGIGLLGGAAVGLGAGALAGKGMTDDVFEKNSILDQDLKSEK